MITTIFFDLGNVLLFFDHRLIHDRLSANSLRKNIEEINKIELASLIDAYETGDYSSLEFFEKMNAVFRFHRFYDFNSFRNDWSDIFWENTELISLLPELKKKYQLGIISNTNEMHIVFLRERFPYLFKQFDHLIYSYELHRRKPSREIFEGALSMAKAQSSESFYLDDNDAYVDAARVLGFNAFRYVGFSALLDIFREENIVSPSDIH